MNMNVSTTDQVISAASAEKSPIVSLVNVSKTYVRGKLVALTDVSFDVGHGEFVVILGPSGAGKSTMLRCINRLAEPTSGQIFLRGNEITNAPRSLRKARQEIGMVFQQFNLVTRLSVMMNVLSGCPIVRPGAVCSTVSRARIALSRSNAWRWSRLGTRRFSEPTH
jgi:ABC-type polar amino acid transport system ATPase subunit